MAIGPATRHAKGFEHLEFIGQSLFIPVFFISIGFHIDLGVFIGTLLDNILLVLAVVGGLIFAKLAAALVTQRLYRFTPLEGLLMWSLSLPQVAATLAAALVAYNTVDKQGQRLIDEPILNTVIVLMVVTSILGPILTERFATQMARMKGER
jgi:Kef-type K+ transport system membrane component KefB